MGAGAWEMISKVRPEYCCIWFSRDFSDRDDAGIVGTIIFVLGLHMEGLQGLKSTNFQLAF